MTLILDQVNERAGERHLDLLGPDRGDVVGHILNGSGMVWASLSGRGEAIRLVAGHVDLLTDPNGELSELADAMVDKFIAAVDQDSEGAAADLMRTYDKQIRSLLLENDVIPSLGALRATLLARLDP